MRKFKTALIYGNFDVIHPGYLRLFRYAKQLSDKLIVGVIPDHENVGGHLYDQSSRLDNVRSNIYVDDAHLMKRGVKNFVETLKPEVVIKGKEHERRANPEEQWLASYGGQLVFSSGEATPTPSETLYPQGRSVLPDVSYLVGSFASQANIKLDELQSTLDGFGKLRVCVIGDVIVDKYIQCYALGMSQEDPTLVVSPYQEKTFLGGAGVVASHVSSLGANVDLVSIVGKDDEAIFAKQRLKEAGVKNKMIVDPNRPTTLKTRFKAEGKTLLRVSRLSQNSIPDILQDQIFDQIVKNIEEYDLFMFSDFNYGCLPQRLLTKLLDLLSEQEIVTVADSQSSSQIGNSTRFKNMSLLCCTEHEARLATQDMECGLGVLMEKLQEAAHPTRIMLKLGRDGVLLNDIMQTDRAILNSIPVFNKSPTDVSGAGDSMMVASGLAIASGSSFINAALLGSLAAAIQISSEGNTPLQVDRLRDQLNDEYFNN